MGREPNNAKALSVVRAQAEQRLEQFLAVPSGTNAKMRNAVYCEAKQDIPTGSIFYMREPVWSAGVGLPTGKTSRARNII